MSRLTIVGIDPSLEATGFACIQPPGIPDLENDADAPLRRFTCYTFGRSGKRMDPMFERFDRIRTVADQVRSAITSTCDSTPDLAVMEDFPHGTPGGSTFDRIGLYWRLYEVCYDLGIPVAMVNVAKLKQFATGIGSGPNAGKDQCMLATVRRYPYVPISNNNESDAFTLAAMGAHGLGDPVAAVPLGHLVAFEATKSQPSFADQLREIGAVK